MTSWLSFHLCLISGPNLSNYSKSPIHKAPLTDTSLSERWHEMAIGRWLRGTKFTSTISSLVANGYATEITEPFGHVPDSLMRPSLRVAFTCGPNVSPKKLRSSASSFRPISDSYHHSAPSAPESGF